MRFSLLSCSPLARDLRLNLLRRLQCCTRTPESPPKTRGPHAHPPLVHVAGFVTRYGVPASHTRRADGRVRESIAKLRVYIVLAVSKLEAPNGWQFRAHPSIKTGVNLADCDRRTGTAVRNISCTPFGVRDWVLRSGSGAGKKKSPSL